MSKKQIQIDIVSDVMCPWCIVGYKQLLPALDKLKDRVDFNIQWQPFELNPNMPEQGQNLREHVKEKYGSTDEQSEQNRVRLQEIGADLDFKFEFSKQSKIVNSFLAHQLIHHALLVSKKTGSEDLQTDVKLALFKAYFSDQKDVSDINVLLEVAGECHLDVLEVKEALLSQKYAEAVRESQSIWIQNGISGVPAVVVDRKYLLTGAQPTQSYLDVFEEVLK